MIIVIEKKRRLITSDLLRLPEERVPYGYIGGAYYYRNIEFIIIVRTFTLLERSYVQSSGGSYNKNRTIEHHTME